MTDDDLLDALCRNLLGLPATVCSWRDLLTARDTVDTLLNDEINRRQAADLPGGVYPRDRRPAAPLPSERTAP